MLLEGRNAVLEALKGDVTVETLYVQKGNFERSTNEAIALARKQGVKVMILDEQAFKAKSETGKARGIMAITTDFTYAVFEDIVQNALTSNKPAVFVLLDGVEDPHNLGAIIRVADCSGASAVIIPKHRSASVTEIVIRTSAGATAHVPVAKVTNINDAIRYLKQQGVKIIAADMDGANAFTSDLTGNIALVIGGEGEGLHELPRKLSDLVVSLPQLGKINSLNASVATGILLYEAIRQRGVK
ncbi:MAG: 23S rRNA (guanosine(2251)-2'-O)-methyltransferase RlmB [Christensenellales bacterium]|jgi:23S rRNA (guanosine2251-2'-O)-methyltransferase